MREVMSKLLDISEKSYYVWKKKSHTKLIELLEKYFTEEELEEFLETGEITSFSKIPSFAVNRLEKLEQKQREQGEEIAQLKNEMTTLHLRFDEKKLEYLKEQDEAIAVLRRKLDEIYGNFGSKIQNYDKAGNPIPSGNPRK